MQKILKDIVSQTKTIELLASTGNQADVSRQMGVSEPTMSRFAKAHREAIDAKAREIAAKIPSMIDNDINLIEMSDKNLLTTDYELSADERFRIKIAEKRRENYYRSMGMFNSHSPAQIFQTFIYNDNRTEATPVLARVLSQINQQGQQYLDSDIIDADMVE